MPSSYRPGPLRRWQRGVRSPIFNMADDFRWEQLDQRLVTPKVSELSQEIQRRAIEGERKAAFETRQIGNAAGFATRFFDFHEKLTDEWAARLFGAYCEAWKQQGCEISPEFVNAVRDRAILTLIATRQTVVSDAYSRRPVASGMPQRSTALGSWKRRMDSLAARWRQRLEAEAAASEQRSAAAASKLPSNSELRSERGSSNSPAPEDGHPKAAVSYSWDDPCHKAWVAQLGTRLRADGVEVILDQWHLELGERLPAFMERMVSHSQLVIIVCTPGYKARFDGRQGGTGYEGHVIAAHILSTGGGDKFIPVLRSGDWSVSTPIALEGVSGVDLRGNPFDEYQYRRLVRRLFGRHDPIPELGNAPEWLKREMNSAGPPQRMAVQLHRAPNNLTVGEWMQREREKAMRGMEGNK